MLKIAEKPSAYPLNSTSGFTLPEFDLPPILPTDVDSLTALLHALIKSHGEVKFAALGHISFLHEQIVLARRRMFGASTESAAQFHLFDEAEVLMWPSAANFTSPCDLINACNSAVRLATSVDKIGEA